MIYSDVPSKLFILWNDWVLRHCDVQWGIPQEMTCIELIY